jgi:hypothetical protein
VVSTAVGAVGAVVVLFVGEVVGLRAGRR